MNLGERTYSLCHAIIFSLFSNCFTPTDEKCLLCFIRVSFPSVSSLPLNRKYGNYQFRKTNNKREFVKKRVLCNRTSYELSTVWLFRFGFLCYFSYTYANPYLVPVLKDIVISVCQDQCINLEEDPAKVFFLRGVNDVLRKL